MERLAFVSENLGYNLGEGGRNTAFNLVKSLSMKVNNLQVYSMAVTNLAMTPCYPLPRNKLFLDYGFARRLRQFSPDAVLYLPASSGTLGGFLRGYMLKLLSGLTKTALICLQPRPISPVLRVLSRMKIIDMAFAQSQQSLKSLKTAGFDTYWLPGGVDAHRFSSVSSTQKKLLRRKYGFSETDRIIVHVGHLESGRNIQYVTPLPARGYSFVLVVSGQFQHDQQLKKSLLVAGIRLICEYMENIEEIYQLADVYLFPTFRVNSAIEAPLSVLEAMSCNLPVVTTRFGALPDMFQEGNGLFFFENQDELSIQIEKAINYSNCNTRNMVSHYSWDAMADRVLSAIG
jgi:glycosyltransferase involved in cell wall biosynthesis